MTTELNATHGCCHHAKARSEPEAVRADVPSYAPAPRAARMDLGEMIGIEGQQVQLGSDDAMGYPADGEGPARRVTLSPFRMDATAVTNAQFAQFVKDTGYLTDAERFGWSFVFYALVHPKAIQSVQHQSAVALAPWWIPVKGACWHSPDGPGSLLVERFDHPVVHVSWNDATAFAAWAGKKLPTEAQWEASARGGLVNATYPWGDELTPLGEHRCNIWQGQFPQVNTADDGYLGTAPARSFEPNAYGLYNMVGNVWEWCADWWSPSWHIPENAQTRCDPKGPATGTERVIRGGSYLCHASHCHRYRLSARSFNAPDSSTGHMGFRCCAPQ